MKSIKRYEAISQLHRLLTAKHQPPLSLVRICDELGGCSQSTAKRAIRDLRDAFDHPIKYDRDRGGYYYDTSDATYHPRELPGLWFTESEIRALLTMRHLLQEIVPGIFEKELVPLGKKVEQILESTGLDAGEIGRRIRVLSIGSRRLNDRVFRCCADAVLKRQRLSFKYKSRSRPDGEEEERYVSPQRLVHYRDNWYLDAWCHYRDALRIFALDQIREPKVAPKPARDMDDAELDRVVKAGYGIFAGEATQIAVLRFSPERAQWVAKETWHPEQTGAYGTDGSFELRVPYSKPDELIMDILKHGAHVEVVEPLELRARVADALAAAGALYETSRWVAGAGLKETA
jgi:predicted DNA-binding transcriptional regulator YafY